MKVAKAKANDNVLDESATGWSSAEPQTGQSPFGVLKSISFRNPDGLEVEVALWGTEAARRFDERITTTAPQGRARHTGDNFGGTPVCPMSGASLCDGRIAGQQFRDQGTPRGR
jgi:hypothetical protein